MESTQMSENLDQEGGGGNGDLENEDIYALIETKDRKTLETEVNQKITEGWYIVGPARICISQVGPTIYYQTMVHGEFGVIAR